MEKLTDIYILCRDRPGYLTLAINSILNSNINRANLIISDNSISNDVEALCLSKYRHITYVRRWPPLNGIEHLEKIISEARNKYLVLFHDDDLMIPNYVETLFGYMEENEHVVSVGCAAEVIDSNGDSKNFTYLGNAKEPQFVTTPQQLLEAYIGLRGNNDHPPFPSYFYRTEYLQRGMFNYSDGGKYADVSFLIKLLAKGPIVWHPSLLVKYRLHGENDSNGIAVINRMKFIKFLCRNNIFSSKSPIIIQQRFLYLLSWYRGLTISSKLFYFNNWRIKIILKFLVTHFFIMSKTDPKFIKYLILRLIKSRL